MKTCPSCGEVPWVHACGDYLYRIICRCGVSGPQGETEADAVKRWDALPRREDAEAERITRDIADADEDEAARDFREEEIAMRDRQIETLSELVRDAKPLLYYGEYGDNPAALAWDLRADAALEEGRK